MKTTSKLISLSAGTALVIVSALSLSSPASAEPALRDRYIGGGVTQGITLGEDGGQDGKFNGNISGRLPIANLPVSARASVLFNDKNSAIVPTITYDFGVAKNTNVYLGGGASFLQDKGVNTALGDRNAAVVTAGVESKIAKNWVVYGDAKLGINSYQSNSSALAVSGGIGLTF
ncbi:hypothetical protein [Merismopedia glauca]|uniref:Outer membrane protein beta-barrel domain-containing protein n=1 Tax=Merismopedia glauca CCAP 1448/3 TaxID=1296344 RepID=A0A2T1C863_9CYAN|nr:hypothetical protein [Merismopedia glauca]PSB04450.1 hypothetical protein C7B64_03940 [Merismopedia glauca CCAP 1448/3]